MIIDYPMDSRSVISEGLDERRLLPDLENASRGFVDQCHRHVFSTLRPDERAQPSS